MKNRNLGVMKDDRKLKLFVSIALFCFIYILFAFRPLEKELHLTPDWTVSVSKVNASAYESSLIPFKLGQSIGYFTEEGKVSSCVTYGFNSSISSDYYATYNADNTVTEVKTPDGLTAGKINAAGFPFFEDNRIYVFMPNGSSVARYEVSGEKLWEYESFAPITAFSSTAGGAAIGFADGHVVSVRDNGTIDQEYYPGGSAVPVILGVGISNDGNLLGCVSGQKKQRFVVSERSGEHSKIIFHEYLPSDSTRQTLVKFSSDSNTAYYNYMGGLGIVDLKNSKASHLRLDGAVLQIEESEDFALVFVLSKNGMKYTLTVIEPFDHVLSTTSFEAKSSFIQVRGKYIFIGKDGEVSRLTISRH